MSSSSDGLSVAGQGATASREESEKSAVHVSPHAVSHATSALHSNHLTVPSFVPDRHASTPGTSFLPGTFVFWVHDDEKVMDAMPGFSTTLFFRSHLDGTLLLRSSLTCHSFLYLFGTFTAKCRMGGPVRDLDSTARSFCIFPLGMCM